MKRRFSDTERRALYIGADGKCQACGRPLPKNWHADHIEPYSKGGETDVLNGQALCPECNLKKGDSGVKWREWQDRCFDDWIVKRQRDYLIAATPGSGKSAMAIRIAKRAFDENEVERVVIVVPTEYLKYQWKDKAHEFGLEIDPTGHSGIETVDYHGMVVTYQSVAMGSTVLHKAGTRRPTFVIFDEIHHAGDGLWGVSMQQAFEHARYRIALTGTPFRSDNEFIPFVTYEQDQDGKMRSKADFPYGYGDALRDSILKSIDFVYIDGLSTWTLNGEDHESYLSADEPDKSVVGQRLRSALNVDSYGVSEWMRETLTQANAKLVELCRDVRKDSAGIIFVENQYCARAFETSRELHALLGETPVVVYSDKPESKELIDRFRRSNDRWIVSVRQISEGVDIPRLAVCVYATIEKTDLIFRQRIARVLRVEKKYPENVTAFAYIPDDADIKALAREIEKERDHIVEADDYGMPDRSTYGPREQFEFLPGKTLDVSVKGVISGSRIYEVSYEDAKQTADATGVSIDYVIKVLNFQASKQSHEPVEVRLEKTEIAVADQVRSMKQGEDRAVSKLAGKLKREHGTDPGEAKKAINKALFAVIGKRKDDCTIADMQLRSEAIKKWIQYGEIS